MNPAPPDDSAQAAYGPRAAELLRAMTARYEHAGEAFVDSFYRQLMQSGKSEKILEALGEAGMRSLKQQQGAHLRMLLDPATSREELLQRAELVGRIHALVGANSSLLVRGHALYRSLLGAVSAHSGFAAEDRETLAQVVEQRLQDDVQRQTEASERVLASY